MKPGLRSTIVVALAVAATPCLSALAQSARPPQPQTATGSQIAGVRVTVLLDEAYTLSQAQRLDEALAKVDEAMAVAERTRDAVGVAMAHRMRGTAFNELGLAREAMPSLEKALAAFEVLGNQAGVASALDGLATAAAILRDVAKVKEYGDRAVRIYEATGDDVGRAWVLIKLVNIGDSPALLQDRIRFVLDTADRAGQASLCGAGLRLKASTHFAAGELDEARASFEAAILVLEKIGDIDSLAAAYLSLGRVFRAHGDYEGAIRRYDRAIELLAPTKDRYAIVEAVNSKAVALGLLSRFDESVRAYERGLALASESGNQRLIEFMEGNLAGGLLSAGQYARAAQGFEQALARKPDRSLAGYRHNQLALALTYLDREAEALPHVDEALAIARELKQVDTLDTRLDNRAWILTRLGRHEDALASSREALELIEQMRARLIPSDFLKRGYGARVEKSYARAVNLLSLLGRDAEALETAERSRARAFLDLLAARDDATLETPGGAITTDAAGRAASGDLASTAMGTPIAAPSLAPLAARLQSTLVSYWTQDDAVLAWVVKPGAGVAHVRVPVARETLARLVDATTAALRQPPAAPATAATRGAAVDDVTALPLRGLGLLALERDDRSAWRELRRLLIDPVRSHLPAPGGRVTIVPHGPLFRLSFAALQGDRGRYLLEDYEIHYAPALSVLELTGRRQAELAAAGRGPWALVGDPASLPIVGAETLAPLPGAAAEIAAIAALSPDRRVVRLTGRAADETSLVAVLRTSRPSVLHFATHGFAFDDPGRMSFLALERRGSAGDLDGRLTLAEVYRLNLSTDLVVLSACRSGSGQVTSDGVLGLARGFFYAGAPSVMATFWDVADATTAILMPSFYQRYARQQPKGASLRSAQLALLADLRAGRVSITASGRRVTLPEHPLLWAAFFLGGEP